MIVTIHQPEHLIWLGLINKIKQADAFVLLDTVQYEKGYFQNRNKIRTRNGWTWLTVPLIKHSSSLNIKDIKISYVEDWQKRYLCLIRANYGKSRFFNNYFPEIEKIINKRYEYLADLNIALINYILVSFGIVGKQIIRSSDLSLPFIKGGSEVNLAICQELGADTYLSGPTGVTYLRQDDYVKSGIKIIFHHFDHPIYTQQVGEFLPGMSSLDALFNLGDEAKKLI